MEKSKCVKCIICFRKFPRKRTYKSTCGCVYICKRKCVKLLELDKNSHQYFYYISYFSDDDICHNLYCSLMCVYNRLIISANFRCIIHRCEDNGRKYLNENYRQSGIKIIYNHQHKQLNEIAYKNYYWIINKYVIDDLTSIIVEYLVE